MARGPARLPYRKGAAADLATLASRLSGAGARAPPASEGQETPQHSAYVEGEKVRQDVVGSADDLEGGVRDKCASQGTRGNRPAHCHLRPARPEPCGRSHHCGILLDVNNVYVSPRRFGFDPIDYIDGIDPGRVGQFHLAGHSNKGRYRLDTHDEPVAPATFRRSMRSWLRAGKLRPSRRTNSRRYSGGPRDVRRDARSSTGSSPVSCSSAAKARTRPREPDRRKVPDGLPVPS